MATTVTTTTLSVEAQTFYDRTLLERLTPNLVFAKYGQKKVLPQNEGNTVNFRRFNSYAPATTALTEGVTPAGKTPTVTEVEAELEQYGDFTEYSDFIDMVGIDPVVTEITEVHGEQAGNTIDQVIRDVVSAGTNVIYATGADTSAVTANDKLTGTLVKKAVKTLRRANAKPLEGGYFIGIIHPDVADDLMNDALWQDVSKYNGGEEIKKGEVGRLHGVRFIVTTNAKVKEGAGASSADVYCSMIIGKGAYGVVELEGAAKPQTIVKPVGSSGSSDPLNQRGSVGWKAAVATARLDELSMVRIETSASA